MPKAERKADRELYVALRREFRHPETGEAMRLVLRIDLDEVASQAGSIVALGDRDADVELRARIHVER